MWWLMPADSHSFAVPLEAVNNLLGCNNFLRTFLVGDSAKKISAGQIQRFLS